MGGFVVSLHNCTLTRTFHLLRDDNESESRRRQFLVSQQIPTDEIEQRVILICCWCAPPLFRQVTVAGSLMIVQRIVRLWVFSGRGEGHTLTPVLEKLRSTSNHKSSKVKVPSKWQVSRSVCGDTLPHSLSIHSGCEWMLCARTLHERLSNRVNVRVHFSSGDTAKNMSLSPFTFRWFEVGCAIWAQMSQIGSSQIKAPAGSIFQKYVYSSFMVKIRIDSESFGLFWFILGWGWCARKKFCQIWIFVFLRSKKVKFGSAEKMGLGCRHVSVSQKVQIFSERSILMKCSILYGGLRGSIWFFKKFYMVFRWG